MVRLFKTQIAFKLFFSSMFVPHVVHKRFLKKYDNDNVFILKGSWCSHIGPFMDHYTLHSLANG